VSCDEVPTSADSVRSCGAGVFLLKACWVVLYLFWTNHWIWVVLGKECDLWLRRIPKKGYNREPLAVSTHSRCERECLSFDWKMYVLHQAALTILVICCRSFQWSGLENKTVSQQKVDHIFIMLFSFFFIS
jgi:hypothetical protein